MKMNERKGISSKLLIIFLMLLGIVVEIRSITYTEDLAGLVSCPDPGVCNGPPEETCENHSQCTMNKHYIDWVDLCCPHGCSGVKVCIDIYLPPSARTTATLSTVKNITTAKYTTQPSKTTTSSTTGITEVSSTVSTKNEVTTKTDQITTTTVKTSKPTTIAKTRSTELEYTSTHVPTQQASTAESRTTAGITTEERKPRTATTVLPSSKTPTTTVVTTHRPGPSVCSKSDAKDILFVIDGTVNYRQYLKIRRKEWNQIKDFVKGIVSEVNDDNNRIGIMQYGGRMEPRMEVDFWESTDTTNLITEIDDIKQIGGRERKTGEALVTAGNKFYEFNSLYEREDAQDIIVLITRGTPSDREQMFSEVEMLKRKMVRVIAIGVSPYPRYLAQSVRQVVSFEQDAVVSKYDELTNKEMDVLEKICLPVKLPGTQSICRNKKYDVYFVLDGSRSINPADFDKKRKFLQDAFFLLESPPSDLNVGLMQFSTIKKTEDLLKLEKHSLNEEREAIENMNYHAGRTTMLGSALAQVNKEVFDGQGGDRSAIENVLVIFSDDRAHDSRTAYREADSMKERNVRIIATTVNEYGYVPEKVRKLATNSKYAMSIQMSNTAYYAKKLVSLICEAEV